VAILVAIIAFVCWQNVDRLFSRSRHISRMSDGSFGAQTSLRQHLFWHSQHVGKQTRYVERIPGVYPYSVVPGGVKDPNSLREVAARDRAVSQHYARFDYSKAHLVRVTEPREVYVSYRIRDTIFWTHKKIRLPAGELLLTDGKITARAKCGNQISEAAMPDVSDQEPEEAVLDQPVALEGPPLPPRLGPTFNLPVGPPIVAPLYAGGFVFPYAPLGGSPVSGCTLKNGVMDKNCHPHKPPTPEPAPIILLASGLSIVMWRYRKSRWLGALKQRTS
jgi:hypothetical protein